MGGKWLLWLSSPANPKQPMGRKIWAVFSEGSQWPQWKTCPLPSGWGSSIWRDMREDHVSLCVWCQFYLACLPVGPNTLPCPCCMLLKEAWHGRKPLTLWPNELKQTGRKKKNSILPENRNKGKLSMYNGVKREKNSLRDNEGEKPMTMTAIINEREKWERRGSFCNGPMAMPMSPLRGRDMTAWQKAQWRLSDESSHSKQRREELANGKKAGGKMIINETTMADMAVKACNI